jgi:FAD/FMN-containing dehydrogenase
VEKIRKTEPEDLAGTRAYANYGLGDERTKDVFGENYERLAQLKAKYDPNLVFNKWFPITPAKA